MKNKTWFKIGAAAAAVLLLVGCDTFGRNQSHQSSSLFAYLYPNQSGHVDHPGIPVLSLPLRVGIAFVPEEPPCRGFGRRFDASLTEAKKMELMKQVSAQFKACPFVSSIEIVPSPYLTPGGGFANLDQIKTMYDVDVMVLLAYDQAQFTDEGFLSLSYWTVVGLYVVHGEKNDTQTMIDAAVYDIASRKLLFRAPGIGNLKGSATPVNLSEQLRRDSARGFDEAATNLTVNLQTALNDFHDRVKAAPTEYQIIKKPGYAGAAAFSGLETALIGGLGVGWLWTRRAQNK